MLWCNDAKVNSHQRWKQTRIRVCFHLWCELTSTMSTSEHCSGIFVETNNYHNLMSLSLLFTGGTIYRKNIRFTFYLLHSSRPSFNFLPSMSLLRAPRVFTSCTHCVRHVLRQWVPSKLMLHREKYLINEWWEISGKLTRQILLQFWMNLINASV